MQAPRIPIFPDQRIFGIAKKRIRLFARSRRWAAAQASATLGSVDLRAVMRRQQTPDFGGQFGRTEQVALHFSAAGRLQRLQLFEGFDAFRRRRHVACRRDIDDRINDRPGVAGFCDVLDEATVDLDLVEGKSLQVAQRGVSGAEIVQRDSKSQLLQLKQNGYRSLVIAYQNSLGNFQLQSVSGAASVQASLMAHSPNRPMKPLSSATGINSAGEIIPRLG